MSGDRWQAVPPAEVSSRLLRRLLETFFRRPVLCLLPLLLLAGLGVFSVRETEQVFRSRGIVTVTNSTLTANLAEVPTNGQGTAWETAAMTTSRTIGELMNTDAFAARVIDRAGLSEAVARGTYDIDDVRSWVGTAATGSNLITVEAAAPTAQIAHDVVSAIIASFVGWVTEGDLADSTAAEQFFAARAETYKGELDTARAALAAFVEANPSVANREEVPPALVPDLERFQADVDLAQQRYLDAVASREDAALAMQQAEIGAMQRLRTLDEPSMPTIAEQRPTTRDRVMTIALYVIAGLLFSAGLVVLATLLDRSIRSADDLRTRLGVEVLAVVPAARRR